MSKHIIDSLDLRCERCALRAFARQEKKYTPDPVPPEIHPGDEYAIGGDVPGAREEVVGRPFVDKAGVLLQEILNIIGIRRDQCRIFNAVECRPPDNNLAQVRAWMNKDKARKSQYLDPLECCRPRMLRSIGALTKVVALGTECASSMAKASRPISNYAGSGETVDGRDVFYTFHPYYCLQTPNIDEVLEAHLTKGFAWFQDTLVPLTCEKFLVTNLRQFTKATARLGPAPRHAGKNTPRIYWDIETDGVTWDARLRCVGFGTKELAYVVPYRSIDGRKLAGLTDPVFGRFVLLWLAGQAERLGGHNSGQYDRRAIFNEFGIEVQSAHDTILKHQLVGNALPRKLGFLTSWLTPMLDAWKADHTATTTRSDRELWSYNADDIMATAAVDGALDKMLLTRGSGHLLPKERALQHVGVMMERTGLQVDFDRARQEDQHWLEQTNKARADVDAILPGLNPGSVQQLGRVFFGEWKLPIVNTSKKTLQPSLDDGTFRMWVASDILASEQYEAVMAVRRYRRATKLRSTYLIPLLNGTLVDERGRIHPGYSRIPASGRYASRNPNAQNWPEFLRAILVAPPGCLLVGADQAGVEARRLAEVANDTSVIGMILVGKDIHNESLEWVYGPGVWELDGAPADRTGKGRKGSDFMLARSRVKNVRYAFQYGAGMKTIREQVGRVEAVVNGRLTFPFAAMPVEDIRYIVERLHNMSPQLKLWWNYQESFYAEHGYVEETVWGRRRYFSRGADRPDLANHPIQSSSAAIIHEAMFDLLGIHEYVTGTVRVTPRNTWGALPFDPVKGTGLITQTHDNLVLCVPEDEAREWAVVLDDVMCRYTHDKRVPYIGEAAVGKRWSDV